jgi:hypothetical protein
MQGQKAGCTFAARWRRLWESSLAATRGFDLRYSSASKIAKLMLRCPVRSIRESRDMRKLNSCEIDFASLAAELNAHLLHCRILYHVFNTKRRGLDEGVFGIYQVGPSLNADCRGSC